MKNSLLIVILFTSFIAFAQDKTKTDWPDLKKYQMENATIAPPAKGEKRVVFMGDSITEFWKTADGDFFHDNNYIDRGIKGQTTSQMLARFHQDVIALHPAVVVILAGTNDIAQNEGPVPMKDIYAKIVAMAQLAQENHIKVVLCSVLPVYDFPWNHGIQPAEKVVQLNNMISAYCMKQNVPYVDYYTKMVDDRKGLRSIYTYDGVHPLKAGYKIMEPLVKNAIKKTLHE